jgi:Mrp family chromosome partitioning ATPase
MTTDTRENGSLAALDRFGTSADTLWTRIAPAKRPGELRTIAFVGAGQGVGTSTVAICTAVGLARHLRAKVTLVEIGLGASALAPLLGLSEAPGLSQVLAGTAPSASCVRGCGLDGLGVVTSGGGVAAPGDFASERTRKLFEELGAGRDFLLIDAPPLVAHPELHPILLHAREAVMVLEAGRTTREEASSLMEILVRSGVDVLGSVLNRVRPVPFA